MLSCASIDISVLSQYLSGSYIPLYSNLPSLGFHSFQHEVATIMELGISIESTAKNPFVVPDTVMTASIRTEVEGPHPPILNISENSKVRLIGYALVGAGESLSRMS
jgi:hypothetical protein